MRIFLIGFMGSGKSLLGRQVAEQLNFVFVDLDKMIEESTGKTISGIFEQQGEWFFRQKEADCLRETLQYESAVIATGGGTPCFFENISWINKHGLSVYLKVTPEILHERLLPLKNDRPLLAHLQNDELMPFIRQKLKERERFYLQSKLVMENPGVEEVIRACGGK